MGLIIHNEKIDSTVAEKLIEICPFSAIEYKNGKLSIGASCKMCKMCVRKGPNGAITFEEEIKPVCDKSLWQGVAVFAEQFAVARVVVEHLRVGARVAEQQLLALPVHLDERHSTCIMTASAT